ncbi:MAG: hypothetical protein HZB50_13525 [Chloroflexi bacterium]|nr:hypothetical protein [Chloroflexota bacterium]
MKKNIFRIALFTLLATFFIYACAPTVEATPTSLASAYLSIEYSDAANVRSQLAYGTLKLADTSNAITPEQAKTLIPLWQAVISLSGDTTTASEELTAVQDQITAAMTAEQLQAIAEMQITNAGLNVFYAEYGIVLPTPIPGVTKVPGSGSGKTEEEKAAAQATAAASGQTTGTGQSAKTLLFEKTIEYLTSVSRQ